MPRPYKRSPLSTPLHSNFDLQRPSSPYLEVSQDFAHRQQQQQQPYLHEALHLAMDKVSERHNALVMERLGEDLGTLFRRHMLKQIKPTPVQGLSTSGRRHSVAVAPRMIDKALGWDDETIAWIGNHALKRLEHMHRKGLVHRDIVSDELDTTLPR
jgi:serine/threonine protein kinase